jgi:hypothetical protein
VCAPNPTYDDFCAFFAFFAIQLLFLPASGRRAPNTGVTPLEGLGHNPDPRQPRGRWSAQRTLQIWNYPAQTPHPLQPRKSNQTAKNAKYAKKMNQLTVGGDSPAGRTSKAPESAANERFHSRSFGFFAD